MFQVIAWIILGLVFTSLVDLLAFKGKVYKEYRPWEFHGITIRFLFFQIILIGLMPLTFLLMIVGVVWWILESDMASKPICSCFKGKS